MAEVSLQMTTYLQLITCACVANALEDWIFLSLQLSLIHLSRLYANIHIYTHTHTCIYV